MIFNRLTTNDYNRLTTLQYMESTHSAPIDGMNLTILRPLLISK